MLGLFWKSYTKHWWWKTVSLKSETWMLTESHHFLSLNFYFLVCDYVCARVYLYYSYLRFYSLSLSLTDYLSLLRFFILFLYWFCSFCWKSEDSKYWKFRKRELEKKTRNQHKKRSKQRKNKTVTWPTTVITTNTIGISMRSTV